MKIFYYHLTNLETNEKRIFTTCNYLGEIGDTIIITFNKYRIDDYAVEHEHIIEAEDY